MDNISMCEKISVCENVSLDLSESSIRYTLHPQVQVAMATAMCLVSVYIVGSNVFLILVMAYSRYQGKYVNRTDRQIGINENIRILCISFYLLQLVIGGFCMPLAIVQVVGNGRWNLGVTFCTVRIYVESLSEVICIYHSVCICLDTYTMVSKPFKYRLFTSKTGYGMALFSWAIPINIFALAISLGWHTEGITEELNCLDAYNTCVPLMSKKFLLVIIVIFVILALCVITIAALVLLEIHRFHQKEDLRIKCNNLGKSNCEDERIDHSKLRKCDAACKLNKTLRNLDAKRQGWAESESSSQDRNSVILVSIIPNETVDVMGSVGNSTPKQNEKCGDSKSNVLLHNSEPNYSKRKAFGVVITLTTMQCVYIIAFLTFASLFVYNTKMFPLWLMSYVTWLRYLHSALILVITFNHKPISKRMQAFLKSC